MFLKDREEPIELKYFRFLRPRMTFTQEEIQYYSNIEKGFEGEQQFDRLLQKKFRTDGLILNDLWLKHNHTAFQLDSLLIFQHALYPIEVKNHEGDFYYDEDKNRWHALTGKERKNPLLQLQRTESLFRQWLQSQRINYSIKPTLVFINPEFHLYNAPRHLPAIFPPQLSRFAKQLNDIPSKTGQKQIEIADFLISQQLRESPYTHIPQYDYPRLKKGVICANCSSFLFHNRDIWICRSCGSKEKHEDAVIKTINEFKFLFPDEKITTKVIFDWCALKGDNRRIRRILSKRFQRNGYGSASYFE